MIERGEDWETPLETGRVPDLVVQGSDAALAAAVHSFRSGVPLVDWTPVGSELARAVGMQAGTDRHNRVIACDLIEVPGATLPVVNALEIGPFPPGRFHRSTGMVVTVDGRTVFDGKGTSIVVATGEFVRGVDLFPRSHPGDGVAEILVLGLAPGDRERFRSRLTTGTQLPHPDAPVFRGNDIAVALSRPLGLRGDGSWTLPGVRALELRVRHPGFQLLI